MLQGQGVLAGGDVSEDIYINQALPITIPTKILNLIDSNVPDRLL